jgi:hypothetical protein
MAWNYDPKHWCERAQEMRSIAAKLKDPQAKAKMLRVAADYEKIAQTAIERLLLHAHSTSRLERGKRPGASRLAANRAPVAASQP